MKKIEINSIQLKEQKFVLFMTLISIPFDVSKFYGVHSVLILFNEA